MNGDGRDDLLGTWDDQGVFYRDSVAGSWIKLASPASLITAGDIDADGTDDLIGIWPSQGGVWVKYSASGSWAKLSSTARDIAAGDMNGDGRDDLLATWDGQGVYYRNSATGSWTKLASQADQVTCGIIDDDDVEDLIGIWPGQGGVWIKSSVSGSWAKISSTARDIAAGPMRAAGAMSASASLERPNEITWPDGRLSTGPEDAADRQDFSTYGPGGGQFSYRQEMNPVPREESTAGRARLRSRSPGEAGFVCEEQKNLSPGEVREPKKEEQPKVKKVARRSAQ
jgi:hypothetical protein